MTDKTLKNECIGLIRAIKKDKGSRLHDDAYFVIPRLRDAAASFSSYGSTGFSDELGKRLELSSYKTDESSLCAYLRRKNADERDIIRIREYLTLIICRAALEGKCDISAFYGAEKLDFRYIINESSALRKKLSLYEDYEKSDDITKALYRASLEKAAGKKGVIPSELLSEIPRHRLTDALLETKSRGVYHIILIICLFILFSCSLYLLCGDFFAVLLCALPFYALCGYLSGKILYRLFPAYRPARLGKKEPLPDCLTVITSVLGENTERLASDLEKMYFSEGRRDGMYFGILSDLGDSDTMYRPDDEKLIRGATAAVDALNKKYGCRFYLFVRDRKYSMSEKKFIAFDRKRGAVCELSRLLVTGGSALHVYGADEKKLVGVPYFITLDSDTLLYPGSSASLLRCAAHPKNRAVTDKKKRVVIKGHGVFQPRVKQKLKNSADTYFSLAVASDSGVDPYQGADFDVYSALYERGSFCGKGLIDAAAFYECCAGVFPDERILSHDMLEGARLRCCAVTDVTMYENTPKNALSYFKRFERWTRGDVQSLPFAGKYIRDKEGKRRSNCISRYDGFLLINAFLHDITPVFAVLCIIYGLIHGYLPLLSLCGMSYIIIPALFSVVFSRADRKTRALGIASLIMQVSFLFYEAQTALFASLRGFARIFTHRRTLAWTTAAAADIVISGRISYLKAFLPSLIAGVVIMLSSGGAAVLTGALFAASPLIGYLTSKAPTKRKTAVKDRDFLINCVKDHKKYFTDLVTAEHNYLPPDNFQELSGVGAAPRTSPTNIGLYLLSVVAFADLGLTDASDIYPALLPTLKTLSGIPKKNGLLYNWYDTRTLCILSDFVSTVDCGNYLCCLIALKQALSEYRDKDERLSELISKTDDLIAECDLSHLYDGGSGLFYIGDGGGADNKYDLLISEMHTTDIAAVSFGYAPAEHIGKLARPVASGKSGRGVLSWSGTSFEYFMPALFLPAPDGSIYRYALRYAAKEQKRDSVKYGGHTLYGKSESCFFAFDADMNYQYKAHGCNSLSLCPDKNERVISPYSLFLMENYDGGFEKTLKALKKLGCYGKYGFYEALDLTRRRVGDGAAVIKCYMAHHIGMSVVAAANGLLGGIFVKRFCRDVRISSALPLLYEKFPASRPVSFKSKGEKETERTAPDRAEADCAAITNTVMTAISDRYGAGLYYKGKCVCPVLSGGLSLFCRPSKPFDLMKYPSFEENEILYSHKDYRAELSVCAGYNAARLKVFCPGGSALCFTPVLNGMTAYRRHTAYNGIFTVCEESDGIIRFINRGKGGFCISVAAYSGKRVPLKYRCRADELYGKEPFGINGGGTPGACVYPRLYAETDRDEVCFYIAAGDDRADADRALVLSAKDFIKAEPPFPGYENGRFCKILGCILRPSPKLSSRTEPGPGRAALYKHGISGDKPVILLDCRGADGVAQIRSVFPAYAQTAVRLLTAQIKADTVVLYDDDDGYYNKKRAELYRMAGSLGLSALIGECVFIIADDGAIGSVLSDISVYTVSSADKSGSVPRAPHEERYGVRRLSSGKAPYFEDGCAAVPVGLSYNPMCFIYANPNFGTLVTDRNCGHTWYKNSRMISLTAHDTTPGGDTERLVLDIDGKKYELFSHSGECRFYPSYGLWRGEIGGVFYTVKVCVDAKMPYKVITVDYNGGGSLAFSALPVLGETYVNGSLRCAVNPDTVIITNTYESPGASLFVYCRDGVAEFDGKTVKMKCRHEKKTVFITGAVSSHTALEYFVRSGGGAAERYAKRVNEYLSPLRLFSTDGALDSFFNLYSRYQALFCRVFARCGPSQDGGAFGFRDQLQDCLCAVYGDPLTVKAHILRCAAHQYEEGDVMHWFHPVTNTGVRTRVSDDMLWLPFAVYKYIALTGDKKILDIKIRYLKSAQLDENETDRYEKAVPSDKKETLMHHLINAASRVRTGAHGLCLMGGGDWNDGMNEAGINGRGESVWLTLFAAEVFRRLGALCSLCGINGEVFPKKAEELLSAVEKHGFDGDHYIRGYTDGGEPFGAAGCNACELDILPQAFAALLGLDPVRVGNALDKVYDKLFDKKNGIIRLFTPPFDGQRGIGYITSYPPGVRENGGQYTHGAIWGVMGMFKAGMPHKGYEMLKALNPENRCKDLYSFMKYGREPYALCGDVYTADGVYGRGGWSWYTGAAGWYFTAALEYLLGYREHDGGFEISPAFCSEFSRFTLTVKRHGTEYTVNAENAEKETVLDGKVTGKTFFVFDKGTHTLDIGRKRC